MAISVHIQARLLSNTIHTQARLLSPRSPRLKPGWHPKKCCQTKP